MIPDPATLSIVLLGALVAGFITGFAGFGTALVSSGFWFHALPAAYVPPLVAMSSVAGQVVGLASVRTAFDWRRAAPYLIGGLAGVPLGVAALALASPALLRGGVGGFLVVYTAAQLTGLTRGRIGSWGGVRADGAVGVAGGFLGGFAGLSGPLPIIWLQLRGGPSAGQRAVYQPFNLVVLGFAGVGMAVSGRIGAPVLVIAALSLPATVLGAWVGSRVSRRVGERAFRNVVLILLLCSGAVLVGESVS